MSRRTKRIIKITGFMVALIVYVLISFHVGMTKDHVTSHDACIRDFFYNARGEKYGFWYWFFRIMTEFGDFIAIGVILVIMAIVTKLDYRFITCLVGLLLAIGTNVIVKNIYLRERPIAEMRWQEEITSSFPSGHSTAAGFLYTFIAYICYHLNIKRGTKLLIFIGCLGLIFTVMISRMVLGVHYFTDVLAGLASGVMMSCLAMIVYHWCEKNNILTEGLIAYIKHHKKEEDE